MTETSNLIGAFRTILKSLATGKEDLGIGERAERGKERGE